MSVVENAMAYLRTKWKRIIIWLISFILASFFLESATGWFFATYMMKAGELGPKSTEFYQSLNILDHIMRTAQVLIVIAASAALILQKAIQWCGAHRIGHATRLLEDIVLNDDEEVVSFGDLAQYILDKRIPLEICRLSNLHTGAVDKLENHPFGILLREKFRVTINTDDRLMSKTNMTEEFLTAVKYFHLSFDEIEKITINAMKSAFIPYEERLRYIYDIIKPGYQKVRNHLYN